MTRQEWLMNVEMRGCDAVPCGIHCSGAVWHEYRDRLARIAENYPEIDCHRPDEWDTFAPLHSRGERFEDAWGCVWENLHDGMTGQVKVHPLADWWDFEGFQPPSPAETDHVHPIDWEHERRLITSARNEGVLAVAGIAHGFFFQRLYYLRGFLALMEDIALADQRLDELCDMLLDFNLGLVRRYLDIGIDVMHFGDDLGMQDRLTISPAAWCRYVKPAYAKLFGLCRQAGAHVYLHTDGYVLDIMPDLLECGVTILNVQDLCHGLDNIKRQLRGKVCVDLDIDRQTVVPRGTPAQIDAHIRNCVRTLALPVGGLSLKCGVYPGTPLENIEAVFRAMTRHRRPFA